MNKTRYSSKSNNAWVITVNMGYGHQRTAYPLRGFAAKGEVINANNYNGIPEKDRRAWRLSQSFYDFISNFKRIPLVGEFTFSIFNTFQRILAFYPKRDLSRPSFTLRQIYSAFERTRWGEDLIEKLKDKTKLEKPLPLVSTFFTPAFMAEFFNYHKEVFCVVCDADIARTWAPLNPQKSRIKYFAPNQRVVNRLELYGVKKENIFLTGYPLPLENIGTKKMEILKEDLSYRLLNLDPQKKYLNKYRDLIELRLGKLPKKPDHPLTIMFSVGGAGAQKEIAVKILRRLIWQIKQGKIRIILSAGVKAKVKEYFEKNITKLDLVGSKNVEIISCLSINDYFQKFNLALRKTDILWTKPSELSFYSALGLPIVIAPTIGSQEEFNKRWLLKSGFGLLQESPAYVDQWIFDWLNEGYFAKAAMQGFIEGEKFGTFNIKKIISKCSG